MFSLNVVLQRFALHPGWLMTGYAVTMPYSDSGSPTVCTWRETEAGSRDYQYSYLPDNFKAATDIFYQPPL